MSSRFALNLVGLLLVGVGVLGWILYYTDWFPAVGGLLALGGALSWLGFVSRLLKESRIKELQEWADRKIFDNRRTIGIAAVFSLICLVTATFVGTLELQSNLGPTPGRTVELRAAEDAEGVTATLSASRRFPLWTTVWSPRRVRVKLGGVPEIEATVRPWRRTRLVAPDDFLRPVVLLRPEPTLLEMLANNPRTLSIQVTSAEPPRERTVPAYRGETVWIGCDEDVDVPDRVLDVWEAKLRAQGRGALLHLWRSPVVPEGEILQIRDGDRLEAHVKGLEGDYAASEFAVRPLRRLRDYPQEEEIHAR
jgi:hypothetical protein